MLFALPTARLRSLGKLLPVRSLALITLAVAAQAHAEPTNATPGEVQIVRPQIDKIAILNNPGRGWETNNRALIDYTTTALPPSKVAYFKYYLKTFLRENGMIDLSPLSADLERAKKSGQQLAFRLMIFSEEEGGEILRAFGVTRGRSYRYIDGDFSGPEQWAPDLEDETTLAVLRKLLIALGTQFDGDPALSHIDIGYAGLWGEWHTSDTVPRVPMPNMRTQRRIIDMHFEAFPRTRKIMQLQDVASLRYALDKGAGIRADCLGGPETTMMRLYPLKLLAARAQDAWKKAPFIFEICWNLSDWEKRGWDSAQVLSKALNQYHPSLINTKSASIPEALRTAFDDTLRHIGYRFAIRELHHPKTAQAGQPIKLRVSYENSGVAPCYGDFRVLVQLKPKAAAAPLVFRSAAQLCNRLPGSFDVEVSLPTAPSTARGDYEIGLAAGQGESLTPSIQLANTNPKDGWYWLSTLRIQ